MEEPKKRINGLSEDALKSLQKEFLVIGKTRVKSWTAWLLIGVVVGTTAGILFVADRSGEFEKGLAAESRAIIPVDQLIAKAEGKDSGFPLLPVPTVSSEVRMRNISGRENPFALSRGDFIGTSARGLFGQNNFVAVGPDVSPVVQNQAAPSVSQPENTGYIVKLAQPSLSEKIKELNQELRKLGKDLKGTKDKPAREALKERIKNLKAERKQTTKEHKIRLKEEKEAQKSRIKSLASSAKVKREYSNAINGFHLDVEAGDAELLSKSGYEIWPNQKVKAVLSDSIPLIRADRAWELKDPEGRSLTGHGVTIAVIDTGVDYTHPDLGGSSLPSYDFLKNVTQNFGKTIYPFPNSLQISGDKVFFLASDRQIYAYDFVLDEIEQVTTNPAYSYYNFFIFDKVLVSIVTDNASGRFGIVEVDLDSFQERILIPFVDTSQFNGNRAGSNLLFSYRASLYQATSTLYVYNFPNKELREIRSDGDYQAHQGVVNGGKAYYHRGNDQFISVYDLEARKDLEPLSYFGIPLDSFGDEILISRFDGGWIGFYTIFNTKTGKAFDVGRVGAESPRPIENFGVQGIFATGRPDQLAEFNDKIVVYEDVEVKDKFHVYDRSSGKDISFTGLQYNHFELALEGNRICFSTTGKEGVFCFDYDPEREYVFQPGPSFNAKVIGGYDIVNNDPDPMDDLGHGTHVAAIAAGNGVLKGVAPDASILAYKVLNSGGVGTSDQIIAGIERALDPNGDGDISDAADVINLSLGGLGDPDDPQSIAIDNAVKVGVVAVVAAGNSGPGGRPDCQHGGNGSEQSICSPGTAREAITVGATDKSDNLAYFSSRGPVKLKSGGVLLKPDLVAPGVDICAAEWDSWLTDRRCFDDKHIAISGTSMATPHVAGAVALLKQKNPSWNPQEIKLALRGSTTPTPWPLPEAGYGRLDVLKAVEKDRPPIASLDPVPSQNGVINISGTAGGEGFKEYALYIGEGLNLASIQWKELIRSSNPVAEGFLHQGLDLAKFNEGFHVLRLVVTGEGGRSGEDMTLIKINNFNFEITSIGENRNYIKGKEKVYGSISLPAASVSEYKVEYQSYFNQTGWKPFCSGRKIPAPGGVLCTGDVSSFPNGLYILRLAVLVDGSWRFNADDEWLRAGVLHELKDGWPAEVNGFPQNHIAVGNIDRDRFNEIVVPHYEECGGNWCEGSKLLFFEHDALPSALSFLNDGTKIQIAAKPALYSELQEKSSLIASLGFSAAAKIFNKLGEVKYSWSANSSSFFISLPTLVDTDYDGELELYTTVYDSSDPVSPIKILGYDKFGKFLNGFPISVKKNKYENIFWLNQQVLLRDKDKFNIAGIGGDVQYGTSFGLNLSLFLDIYSPDGALVKRVNLFDDGSKSVQPVFAYAAGGDLNGDGDSEIVVGYSIIDIDLFLENSFNPSAYKTHIKIFNSRGRPVGKEFSIEGYTVKSVAVGDLGYKNPSVVVLLSDTWPTYAEGQKILAMDSRGKILFEKNVPDSNDLLQGVAIGNVEGDQKSEIVVNYRPRWYQQGLSGFYIFNDRGELKRNIEVPTLGEVDDYWGNFPILTDLDGDKKTDIVQQSLFIPLGKINQENDTRIYAFSLDNPYDVEEMSWPTVLHDDQHTSIYSLPYPDLVIKEASVTEDNGKLRYDVLVLNAGLQNSGQWEFKVKDKDGPPETTRHPALKPGKTIKLKGKISKLPVTFTLDPQNDIKEQNEENNKLVIEKATEPPPPPPPSGFVTLLTPNGGEVWQLGNMHTIQWTPYDPMQNINAFPLIAAYLEKSADGKKFTTVGKILESGKASIHWAGDIDLLGKYPEPGKYYIRIENSETGKKDRSDKPFELVPYGTLKADLKINGSDDPVTVPPEGAEYPVTWNSNTEKCSIFNGTLPYDDPDSLLNDLPPSGERTMRFLPGGQYGSYMSLWCEAKAKIEGTASDYILITGSDPEKGALLFPGDPLVMVLSPNGGETLAWSQNHEIKWESSGIDAVSVALYKNDAFFSWIARDVPAKGKSGSFRWNSEKTISSSDIGDSAFKIYMIGHKIGKGAVEDKSDYPFSIAE